jgi:hypothetical protein
MVTALDDLILANVSACADAIIPKPNNAATNKFFFMNTPSLLLKTQQYTLNQAKS